MGLKILYQAAVTAKAGREGRVESADGVLKMDTTMPKELGGPGKPGATNPEQLFAAGYAACFGGALGLVARQMKKPLSDINVTGVAGIGPNDSGGFGLAVELKVRLPEVSRDEAEKLVAAAHQVCPYSNATRGNIEVKLTVE